MHYYYSTMSAPEPNNIKYKKIVEFLIKEENQIKTFATFLKSMQDFEKRNIDTLKEFKTEIGTIIGKLVDKQFAKHFSSFSIHDSEAKAS